MLQFPPIPSWDSMHPLIVHFPIVLLLLSPVFILISAALDPRKGQPYLITGLSLLLLGTGSLFFAASTGEATAELAERGGGMDAVLSAHEQLAKETEVIFLSLSVILIGMVVLFRFLRRQRTRLASTILPLAFLSLYSVGILFVVNTAHAGGRLVHEFGVHAMIPTENVQSPSPSVATMSADKGE